MQLALASHESWEPASCFVLVIVLFVVVQCADQQDEIAVQPDQQDEIVDQ